MLKIPGGRRSVPSRLKPEWPKSHRDQPLSHERASTRVANPIEPWVRKMYWYNKTRKTLAQWLKASSVRHRIVRPWRRSPSTPTRQTSGTMQESVLMKGCTSRAQRRPVSGRCLIEGQAIFVRKVNRAVESEAPRSIARHRTGPTWHRSTPMLSICTPMRRSRGRREGRICLGQWRHG